MQKKFLVLSFCLLAQAAHADTFIMKDGSKIVGTIMRKDATSYVIEAQITKSIKEEKTIAKADVEKIQSERVDLTVFETLKKLIPTPDALPVSDYDARIKKVEKFLIDHRSSEKVKDAKDILTELKTELADIQAGGIKLSGKMVPAKEYQENLYEIDAKIQEDKIHALIKSGQVLSVLRAFTPFSQDFRNTRSYTALLPVMNQVITSYQHDVNGLIASFDARTKVRLAGLDRMTNKDRQNTEQAIQEEKAQCEALLAREKELKIQWVTIHPYFKPSLEETISYAQQVLSEFTNEKSTPPVDGGKIFRETLSLLQSEPDANAVSTAMNAAKSAGIPPRYITILEEAAKSKGPEETK